MVTLQILKVQIQEEIYSIPTSSIETTVEVSPEKIFTIEGQEAINYHSRPIPLVQMEEILEISSGEEEMENGKQPAIILGAAEKRVAFLVGKLIGEDAVVAKALSSHLERVRNVSGATILGNGRVSLILNVPDLIESAQYRTLKSKKRKAVEVKGDIKKSILIIEDSITTRTLEVNILESAGYEVVAATDGEDGYSKLMNQTFDLIVTDIQMPHMDGFAFTQKVKSDQKYQQIPVILLTSLESPAEKKRGVEVGADAYIIKSSFDQNNLLDTISRLL
jgi:two-component system chemotaxis sensor kinase CheA